MQAHRHLAIPGFAQRAGILPLHSHRVRALLGEARVIDHPNRVRRQLRRHSLRQSLPNRSPIPRTLSDQLLHGLHVPLGQTRGHRLDRFSLAVQQQPAHVHLTPVRALTAPQRLQQVGQELFQTLSAFLDCASVMLATVTRSSRVNNLT